jgi:hypothetical protein
MLLKILPFVLHTSPLSVQALQSRSCVSYVSYVQSPHNRLIKDYTEIFYVIDKGDIPSIQCKTRLGGPKSMTNLLATNKL